MRRVYLGLGLVVWMVSVVLLSGCAVRAEGVESGKLSVVATNFPPYDFARQLVGDAADVRMLIKPGIESHAYEPSPQDMMAIQNADVFLYIGGENDQWVDRILGSMDLSGKQVVKLIDHVETLEEHEEEDEHDHAEHGDEVHGIDEHIWTSPRNASLMVKAISAALVKAAPERKAAFGERLTAYEADLKLLDQEFEQLVSGAARKELIFGDRFPFRYLVVDYSLTAHAAFPSCANDTEPSAKTIAALIERVKDDSIPVVYKIEQSNGRVAKVIAEATGATVETLHSCHNVTKDELNGGATYLSLMQANLEALRAGLY